MWELDCEEGWAPKNWCFWTAVLEKTLESPLDCKEIQPVHSEGDQPWDFFGRNDAEAETLVLWLPHVKSWLTGKDSDAGRDWGQEEKGTTGWDGWMASLTWWTWVWVNSGSWWWTGRPGVLQFIGSQRVRHDWVTELNWLMRVCRTQWVQTPCSSEEESEAWGDEWLPKVQSQASTATPLLPRASGFSRTSFIEDNVPGAGDTKSFCFSGLEGRNDVVGGAPTLEPENLSSNSWLLH